MAKVGGHIGHGAAECTQAHCKKGAHRSRGTTRLFQLRTTTWFDCRISNEPSRMFLNERFTSSLTSPNCRTR